jgi:DNA polymerase-3 subunit alpha
MWVPLHLHSQYSILDATCPIQGIVDKAVAFQIPAVALTDHGNLHGAVEFYKACVGANVKPIIGCELYVAPGSRQDKKKIHSGAKVAHHLTLLAKNDIGYHNLCRLSSLGYLEGFYYHPRIDKELLEKYHEGLICLSGCLSSELAHLVLQNDLSEAYQQIKWYKDLFKEDYYFEIMRHHMAPELVDRLPETWLRQQYSEYVDKQQRVNQKLIQLSRELNVPLVATNDTHYLEPDDWQAHEILLNIQSGEPVELWERDSLGNPVHRVPNPKRRVYSSHEFYFKSPQQMQELFSDVPDALSNTLIVAEKCQLKLDFKTKHYPVFVPPHLRGQSYTPAEREAASLEYLKKLCQEGIARRYTADKLQKVAEKYPGQDPMDVVLKRLDREYSIIASMAMCDYLLIVWDFIHWAKNAGIPVGPGRGSGAGSIILYLIGITDIEPLRFHLFFERFINPERFSYPDIDVDICMDGRQRVIDYTVNTYGKENVAQIITFGTMKAKMTIKDVGRVLSVPLSKVNAIAKLVPEDPTMTLQRALDLDVELSQMVLDDDEAHRILEMGTRLEGSIRNTGIHAAGLIICGDPLTDHIPLCVAKDSDMAATQYSMKPVEAVGMLKIDFLGLKTLTCIQLCVDEINRRTGKKIDWVNIDLEDLPTFELLQQGRTLGVFQMESGGMQELARQLRPDKFEEIIAIGALYRPGPMDMIPSFINRKHGKEVIEYDHEWLGSILSETYGIMVYQEQVMQIAQTLAGYSLGEGDVLRRAMGKKDKEQMAKEREKFRKGAIERGIQDAVASSIFDKMEKFASYGFNKSHAAAYGYLTYVTAYLKANYPSEWMAALMTCDRDDVSKVAKFIRECQALNISILPPDVNEAGLNFVATEKGIRFAMSGIKGVGEGVVEIIIEERKKQGPFKDYYDFFKRIDLKKMGKKPIEHLVDAGSFDFTGWSRDQLRLSIDQMYDAALKKQKEQASGIRTLFDILGTDLESSFKTPPDVPQPTPKRDILAKEKALLGFFLTGHPMDAYKKVLDRLSCRPLNHLEACDHQAVFRSAFIVESVTVRLSAKSQKKFAIAMISDGMESYELPIWPDLYEQYASLVEENQLLYAVLQADKKEEVARLQCRWLADLTKVDEAMIEICDQAFDRAKLMVSRTEQFKKLAAEKQKTVEKQKMATQESVFKLAIDLQVARLSHVMKLQELFVQHPGNLSVELAFKCGGRVLSRLTIPANKGVGKLDQLQAAVLTIPSVKIEL